MECPICYSNEATYVIQCGSKTTHAVCDHCEVQMRMKEPATTKGRILKCPMCRVNETKVGKRSTYSYEYELSKIYETVRPRVSQVNSLEDIANAIRDMPRSTIARYIRMFPGLERYFEVYDPRTARVQPRPASRVQAAAQAVSAAQARAAQAAARPVQATQPAPVQAAPVQAPVYCQSGNRELRQCTTKSKTKRICTFIGCTKYVCRSCRQCITH